MGYLFYYLKCGFRLTFGRLRFLPKKMPATEVAGVLIMVFVVRKRSG